MAGTKRNLGMKDLYYAKVTKNTADEYVCEAPKKLCRAISATIKTKFNNEKLYSDSELEDSINQFDSIEVELEGDHIAAEDRAVLIGAKYEGGILEEDTNMEAPEVAIMFRDKRANGKYEFVTLYCGKFGEEDEDKHETSEDKIKTQTEKLKGTFYGRTKDNKFRLRIFEDELVEGDTDAKTVITNWFSKVPNQTATGE